VGVLQGRRVELEVHLDEEVGAAEKDLDVAAFLEGDRKDPVVVEEIQTTPWDQIHNLVVVERWFAHRTDRKEDVGIDQDQGANFVLKLDLLKREGRIDSA